MELKVQKRDKFGKQVRVLRENRLIPAELYGHGVENVHLSVSAADFRSAYKEAGLNRIIDIVIDGAKKSVLIYGVQANSLDNEIESVDFYQVNMKEELEAKVPLKFIGNSPAVKDKGGILVKAMDEIEVRALPQDIPSEIAVDLGILADLNQSIYVKDLPTNGKFKFTIGLSNAVVSVSEPISEEEETAMAAEVKAEDIVVETEEKKAQRDAKTVIGAAEKVAEAPAKTKEKK